MAVAAGGDVSRMPGPRELVVETFPRADKHYLVCYPFEGRLAHQTLGMLLTRRLERARARPLGFVANEYALAVWCVGDVGAMIRQGRLDLAGCSIPTCWATISKPGSPNRR
jgi:ATP-dependent Lhr-like helicase